MKKLFILWILGVLPGSLFLEPVASDDPPLEVSAQDVLDGHNTERKRAKLPLFKLSERLNEAAAIQAADMAEHKTMSHEGTDGSSPFDRLKRIKYQFQSAAENVARGQLTVDGVMKDWMNSEHHRENILGDYSEIGVSVKTDADGQNFWCVDFGKPWPSLDPAEAEKEVVELINKERTLARKDPLRVEIKLTEVAASQAEFMASGQSLDAEVAKKNNPFESIKQNGLRYRDVAQTAAAGLSTPEELVKYWFEQPEYRKTLIDSFHDVGVGYARDEKGSPYWCLFLGRRLPEK